nr:immunoglobulin heavy chain junction region [Mus musculus]MBK4186764.1 immunoglobulin heavy chain junction region [Mus musculus]MBK4186765.1 immunoglobulin heavy chain junction region [Mus musculus]MBK4186766.1 immunoglobulin heavy chain junction region [Mus musculus]MBK4186768.1 immunoglobulin heavy chain junction region [Mus musculus]
CARRRIYYDYDREYYYAMDYW